MIDIPTEILLHIISFIPDATLKDLLGVSHVFFNIGMDLRYKEIVIVTRNTTTAMRSLNRLSEPSVAKRVHRLSLQLTHVKDPSRSASPRPTESASMRKQIQHTFSRVFKPSKEGVSKEPGVREATFDDVINELISVNPNLCNIREFSIDSWDLPPSYTLAPLLSSSWHSFGMKLKVLSVGGNLVGYRTLVESHPILDCLEELRVEITNNIFRVDQDADAAILTSHLAPFINSLSSQLKLFKLWSWANVDLSNLFDQLSSFPRLENLSIRTDFNNSFRIDPQGLQRHLRDSSSTLRFLELRLKSAGIITNPSLEERLGQWLTECLSDKLFLCHLRCLDLYPTNIEHGIGVTLACIQRNSQTLKEITVRDRYLQFDEAKQLLNALASCPNLTSLRLSAWKLEIGFLDLLASKVPGIKRLWLSIGQTLNSSQPGDSAYSLFQSLKERSYVGWKLYDLTIWQGGQEVDSTTMEALAASIPSVKSFFGHGHMHLHVA